MPVDDIVLEKQNYEQFERDLKASYIGNNTYKEDLTDCTYKEGQCLYKVDDTSKTNKNNKPQVVKKVAINKKGLLQTTKLFDDLHVITYTWKDNLGRANSTGKKSILVDGIRISNNRVEPYKAFIKNPREFMIDAYLKCEKIFSAKYVATKYKFDLYFYHNIPYTKPNGTTGYKCIVLSYYDEELKQLSIKSTKYINETNPKLSTISKRCKNISEMNGYYYDPGKTRYNDICECIEKYTGYIADVRTPKREQLGYINNLDPIKFAICLEQKQMRDDLLQSNKDPWQGLDIFRKPKWLEMLINDIHSIENKHRYINDKGESSINRKDVKIALNELLLNPIYKSYIPKITEVIENYKLDEK